MTESPKYALLSEQAESLGVDLKRTSSIKILSFYKHIVISMQDFLYDISLNEIFPSVVINMEKDMRQINKKLNDWALKPPDDLRMTRIYSSFDDLRNYLGKTEKNFGDFIKSKGKNTNYLRISRDENLYKARKLLDVVPDLNPTL